MFLSMGLDGRFKLSLSARRAWIEICICPRLPWFLSVALRKESVDRNTLSKNPVIGIDKSLSARRAWIEIDWASVITAMTSQSRSPQGERG